MSLARRIFPSLMVLWLSTGAVARADSLEEATDEMKKAKLSLDHHEYEAAIGHYIVARSLAPESSGPYLGLGLAYAALGRCPEAIPVLEEYLRRKKTDANPAALPTLHACQSSHGGGKILGHIAVDSEPAEADVRLDDENAAPARTPIELTAAPGPHVLYLSRAGYRDEIRSVTVVTSRTASVVVTLQPIQLPMPGVPLPPPGPPRGTLAVKVGPLPATLRINGMVVQGERRTYLEELPPGLYQVEVERSGYETDSRDVWLRSGERSEVGFKLASSHPREVRRKVGIAIGVIVAAGAAAAAIAVGVVYGTPKGETRFGTAVVP
jgi:hypothetical protein